MTLCVEVIPTLLVLWWVPFTPHVFPTKSLGLTLPSQSQVRLPTPQPVGFGGVDYITLQTRLNPISAINRYCLERSGGRCTVAGTREEVAGKVVWDNGLKNYLGALEPRFMLCT